MKGSISRKRRLKHKQTFCEHRFVNTPLSIVSKVAGIPENPPQMIPIGVNKYCNKCGLQKNELPPRNKI